MTDGVRSVRTQVARVVAVVTVIAGLVLLLGALLITMDANRHNELVSFTIHAADRLDFGVFSREDGIKHFTGSSAETKNALLNWGIAALVWIAGGRLLARLIRP